MTIAKSQRRIIRDRARNCCEYCLLPASAGTIPFHVDHIIPIKHGGLDDVNNLCLACYKCNAHKGHDLAGLDPETGKITQLYHPRKQTWNEHFIIQSDMRIEGRTTVRILQMNDKDRIENRQILAELDEYPCSKE